MSKSSFSQQRSLSQMLSGYAIAMWRSMGQLGQSYWFTISRRLPALSIRFRAQTTSAERIYRSWRLLKKSDDRKS